jgi:PAS domain S-box-containing protein
MNSRRILLGIGVAILLLTINASIAFVSLRNLAENNRRVTQTHRVLVKLEETHSLLREAESARHGLHEADDPRHFTPALHAIARFARKLNELREATIDNVRHQRRIDRLQGLADDKLSELRFTIAARQPGAQAADEKLATHPGRQALRQIRSLIDDMRHEEEALLELRSIHTDASLVSAKSTLFLSTLAEFALVALAFILFRRDERNREAAEASLRESADRLRKLALVASRTDNAVVITDAHKRIEWVNEGFVRLTGYTADEVQGRLPNQLLQGPETDTAAIAEMRSHLMAGEGFQIEVLNYTKSGRQFWNFVEVQPIRDLEGRLTNFIAIERDVSERRRAEKNIREYAQALELANNNLSRYCQAAEAATRAKSDFLANMSHEIRTPMTAILGHAELLLEGGQNPPARRASAVAIQRNGEHLLRIINDILDLSRIEAGKLSVERTSCSPVRLLGDVKAMMQARAVAQNLAFDCEFSGPIPEQIVSDPTRLRQILINLVGNAVKFTERGEVRVVCRLETGPADDRARLCFDVIDTGIGIAADKRAQLFQPFVQIDNSATRRFGGTGLGLFICQHLAEALGGTIEVDSTPGSGSRFTLALEIGPLGDLAMAGDIGAAARTLPGTEPEELSGDEAALLSGRRILLAEDGVDNQYLISLHLRTAGIEVDIVENGRQAVDRALAAAGAGRPYDVILMDMQMPELDGYSATGTLRDENYRGRIVALTAHAMQGERKKCLAAGCDDYLSKPITRVQLLRALAANLTAARPHSAAPEPESAAGPITSRYAGDPRLADAVGRFIGRIPDRIETLERAAQAHDRGALLREAHQLKGAAGGIRFRSADRGRRGARNRTSAIGARGGGGSSRAAESDCPVPARGGATR